MVVPVRATPLLPHSTIPWAESISLGDALAPTARPRRGSLCRDQGLPLGGVVRVATVTAAVAAVVVQSGACVIRDWTDHRPLVMVMGGFVLDWCTPRRLLYRRRTCRSPRENDTEFLFCGRRWLGLVVSSAHMWQKVPLVDFFALSKKHNQPHRSVLFDLSQNCTFRWLYRLVGPTHARLAPAA